MRDDITRRGGDEYNTREEINQKVEKNDHDGDDGGAGGGGASIVYVHTFCAELIGESSLELCRTELKLKCDVDVLSWFKLNPAQSRAMQGRIINLQGKPRIGQFFLNHPVIKGAHCFRSTARLCPQKIQQETRFHSKY